jgi:5'-nucleotidase (lipoprotein e(P4) family)
MSLRNSAAVLMAALYLVSCSGSKEAMSDAAVLATQSTDATLWYAESAENQYIYLQAYHYATQLVAKKTARDGKRPRAVVLDLDETVLDNSPYQYRMIAKGQTYSTETWNAWVNEASAEALPGALDFVNYCQKVGVEVFYISNRSVETFQATTQNLKNLGFPNADEEHVLLKESSSDKTERRDLVSNDYEIIVLLGDQLTDFDQVFDNSNAGERTDMVTSMWEQMRTSFVLFPNPIYGGWMDPILNGAEGDKKKRKSKENFVNDQLR